MSNLKQNGRLRWNPSYLRRRGQMTPGQKKALRDHWQTFGIEFHQGQHIDLADSFPPELAESPLFIEIGFGMGENLVHQAKTHPEARILGIEVHKPGIGAAVKKLVETGVNNVRVMRGDARLVLSDFLAPSVSCQRVSVLFPDPWPDESNAHRRIVQRDLIELLETRMIAGGELHLATDVEAYAQYCEAILSAYPSWSPVAMENLANFRGPTQYEQKGLEKGHAIFDQLYLYKVAEA